MDVVFKPFLVMNKSCKAYFENEKYIVIHTTQGIWDLIQESKLCCAAVFSLLPKSLKSQYGQLSANSFLNWLWPDRDLTTYWSHMFSYWIYLFTSPGIFQVAQIQCNWGKTHYTTCCMSDGPFSNWVCSKYAGSIPKLRKVSLCSSDQTISLSIVLNHLYWESPWKNLALFTQYKWIGKQKLEECKTWADIWLLRHWIKMPGIVCMFGSILITFWQTHIHKQGIIIH